MSRMIARRPRSAPARPPGCCTTTDEATLRPMATESRNGSGPDESDNQTPFGRFERMTRQVLSVPKAEIDKKHTKAKRTRARSRS